MAPLGTGRNLGEVEALGLQPGGPCLGLELVAASVGELSERGPGWR